MPPVLLYVDFAGRRRRSARSATTAIPKGIPHQQGDLPSASPNRPYLRCDGDLWPRVWAEGPAGCDRATFLVRTLVAFA